LVRYGEVPFRAKWELGHLVPSSQTIKRLHMQANACKCNLFLC
jgi:hypothetical protein